MTVTTLQEQDEFDAFWGQKEPDWASKRGEILGLTVAKCFVLLIEGGRGGGGEAGPNRADG